MQLDLFARYKNSLCHFPKLTRKLQSVKLVDQSLGQLQIDIKWSNQLMMHAGVECTEHLTPVSHHFKLSVDILVDKDKHHALFTVQDYIATLHDHALLLQRIIVHGA